MYEAFYKLREKPFSLVPDPEFIYWSKSHSMALTMLEYGVLNGSGFTVITGEVGAGKTTLIRQLLNELPEELVVGMVSNTQSGHGNILEWIMMSLDQSFDGLSYVGLYQKFQEFLIEQFANNRRTVIILDEAQNLQIEALEELRMMSNINADKHCLLQTILVGQPELKLLLDKPEVRQFAQRVTSDYHLGLLNREEVVAYIDHRLIVAGATRLLFTDEACDLIYQKSGGTPRVINTICDTALVYGFAEGAEIIDMNVIRSVVDDRRSHGVFSKNAVG